MKNKNIVHLIKLPREKDAPYLSSPELQAFESVVRETMLYNPIYLQSRSAKLQEKGHPAFSKVLETHFYSHIYVHRIEAEEIIANLKIGKLITLAGHAGSGKSTILRKIADDLMAKAIDQSRENGEFPKNDFPNTVVYYIDLREYFDVLATREELKGSPHKYNSNKREKDVCDIINEVIRKSCLWEEDKKAFPYGDLESRRRHWLRFKVFHDQHYSKLLEKIIRKHSPKTDSEWEDILHSQEYSNELDKLDDSLMASGTENLKLMLQFLQEEGIRCVVIIDNMDRYTYLTQADVFIKAHDHAKLKLTVPVLAIRNINIRRLIADGEEDYKTFLSDLKTHGISTLAADRPYIQVKASKDTIRSFISKRMNFISAFGEDLLPDPSGFQRFKDEHLSFYQDLINNLRHDVLHPQLIDWNNESLRNVGWEMFKLINALMLSRVKDPDNYFNVRSIYRDAKKVEIDHHRLRSFIYRFMICFPSPFPEPSIINIFKPLESASTTRSVYCLPLKVLEYLIVNSEKEEGTEYQAILNDFAVLGVEAETIFKTLQQLRAPRHDADVEDPTGYVIIDRSEGNIKVDMKGSTRIEVLPAGRFLAYSLSISCEYLFWMSLSTPLDVLLFDSRPTIKDIDSDSFHVEVVLKFLEQVLLPITNAEIDSYLLLTGEKAQGSEYNRIMRKFFIQKYSEPQFYLSRCVDSIQNFLQFTNIITREKEQYRNRLSKIEKEIEEKLEKYRGKK